MCPVPRACQGVSAPQLDGVPSSLCTEQLRGRCRAWWQVAGSPLSGAALTLSGQPGPGDGAAPTAEGWRLKADH